MISVRKNVKRKITATLLGVIAALSLLIVGLQAVNAFSMLRIAPVTTNAMSPEIPQGSLIVAQLTPEEQIKTGDVITIGVGEERSNLIGRVLDINSSDGEYYNISLKGDQRALPSDFPYKVKDVTYKEQFSIPLIGFVVQFFSSAVGFALLSILMVGLSLFYILGLHSRMTREQRSTRWVAKARKKAVLRVEERRNHGGVDEMKALMAEESVV
jgi:signal peptidase I